MRLVKWIKRFILAVQFMTKIPISVQLDVDEQDFAQSMLFYPVVGLIVGALMTVVYYIFSLIASGLLPSVAAVLSGVAVTGAFHLDGLADVCDALLSNKDRTGMLAVMKDSRIGTGGAVAIASILILKIAVLTEMSGNAAYDALLLAPVLGRTGIVTAAAISQYARAEGGLGQHFIDKTGWLQMIWTAVIALAIAALAIGYAALVFLAAEFLTAVLFAKYMESKIGGMTGDTLGATCEITEVVVLLMFAVSMR
ncbi:MAG: adenosylcobinamide-GDP ribazoletransferase [Clostridiales bacterium]|nr:adenosylcobinamide-GDP ribazoletransferase [Clostridiales bacterium]MDK2992275.1 adenosylcobinamide-GDP ribazoletransferase [Clostridiales bacterium]